MSKVYEDYLKKLGKDPDEDYFDNIATTNVYLNLLELSTVVHREIYTYENNRLNDYIARLSSAINEPINKLSIELFREIYTSLYINFGVNDITDLKINKTKDSDPKVTIGKNPVADYMNPYELRINSAALKNVLDEEIRDDKRNASRGISRCLGLAKENAEKASGRTLRKFCPARSSETGVSMEAKKITDRNSKRIIPLINQVNTKFKNADSTRDFFKQFPIYDNFDISIPANKKAHDEYLLKFVNVINKFKKAGYTEFTIENFFKLYDSTYYGTTYLESMGVSVTKYFLNIYDDCKFSKADFQAECKKLDHIESCIDNLNKQSIKDNNLMSQAIKDFASFERECCMERLTNYNEEKSPFVGLSNLEIRNSERAIKLPEFSPVFVFAGLTKKFTHEPNFADTRKRLAKENSNSILANDKMPKLVEMAKTVNQKFYAYESSDIMFSLADAVTKPAPYKEYLGKKGPDGTGKKSKEDYCK